MARRAAKVEPITPADFVFDPENLIPPSKVPAEHKEAYWSNLVDSLDLLRAACATEEFFPLLREIPKAFWEKNFFVYLYRQFPKVKNAEKDKYIDRYPFPIDEASVKEEHGGGGYIAYLNINGKEQLKQITFAIDGQPKFKPGQILVDAQGNPLAPASSLQSSEQTDIAKVIDASAKANESAMGILAHASETAIDMVKAQAVKDGTPPDTKFQERLLDVLLNKALTPAVAPVPPADPLRDKLMEMVVERAFGEKENPETKSQDDESLFERGAAIVERVTGKSLADVMKPSSRAATDEYGWVAPLANVALQALTQLPAIMRQAAEAREAEFQRQIYLNQLRAGQTPQNALPPAPAKMQATPQPVIQPPAQPPNKQQTVSGIVEYLCNAFDKQKHTGADVGAAISVMFSDLIEAHGLEKALYDPNAMMGELIGLPNVAALLAQRTQHAKWGEFQGDFLGYMQDRWGDISLEEPKTGPQPVA